jgi:hypothetical protein
MRYIISERQYNLLTEQSQPIKIELPKDEELINKYCKPIQIPKQNLENLPTEILNDMTSLVLGQLRRKLDYDSKSIDKNENSKLKKIVPKLESAIIPIIQSSIKNGAMHRAGYVNYDMTNDAKKLAETFYKVLDSEYNTLMNRTIARALITQKNKNVVMDEVENYFDAIETVIARMRYASSWTFNHMNYELLEKLPDKGLCKKVLVVKDDGYKVKPYHPRMDYFISPNFVDKEIDTTTIVKPYFDKISQLVNSLA